MSGEEKTYRVYATTPNYIYADIKANSAALACYLAGNKKQDWRPSSELDVGGEPVESQPQVLDVEEITS
jgi:hypothetical protein